MEMKKFDSRHLTACSSFNLLDVDYRIEIETVHPYHHDLVVAPLSHSLERVVRYTLDLSNNNKNFICSFDYDRGMKELIDHTNVYFI